MDIFFDIFFTSTKKFQYSEPIDCLFSDLQSVTVRRKPFAFIIESVNDGCIS